MSAGQWDLLTTINLGASVDPGGVGADKLVYSISGIWSPLSKTMQFLGSYHADTVMRYIVYDEATNTWSIADSSLTHTHGYDETCIDPYSDILYRRVNDAGSFTGRVYRQLPGTSTWSSIFTWSGIQQVSSAQDWWSGSMSGAGANGALILYSAGDIGGQVIIYDPIANAVISNLTHFSSDSDTYHIFMQYSEPKNCAIFGGGNANPRRVFRLNSDRTITTMSDAPLDLGIQRGNVTVDPVSGVFLALGTNEFWQYDPAGSGTWTQLANPPSTAGDYHYPTANSVISWPVVEHGVAIFTSVIGTNYYFNVYKHQLSSPPATPKRVAVKR